MSIGWRASASDGGISMPVAAQVCVGAPWSIAFWVYSPDNAAGSDFATFYNEDDGFPILTTIQMKLTGVLRFFHRQVNGVQVQMDSGALDDSAWHWVLWRCVAINNYELYVDGALVATSTTSVDRQVISGSGSVLIGNPGSNSIPVNGARMERFISFSRAITVTEAAAYLSHTPPATPHVWYALTGANPELDLSGNGYNGTPTDLLASSDTSGFVDATAWQPVVSFGTDNWRVVSNGQGRLYGIGSTSGSSALVVKYSDDDGLTWSAPTAITPSYSVADQPIYRVMAAHGDTILLVTSQGAGNDLYAHVSTDQGGTWTSTNLSNGDGTLKAYRSSVVINPVTGSLHVANGRPFDDATKPIGYWRSTDNGQTWSGGVLRSAQRTDPDMLVVQDVVHLVNERRSAPSPGTPQAVEHQFSTDDGATWSAAVDLWSVTPGSGTTPELRGRLVTNGSVVCVLGEGTIESGTTTRAIWAVRSTNKGVSWSNATKIIEETTVDSGHQQTFQWSSLMYALYSRNVGVEGVVGADVYNLTSPDGGQNWTKQQVALQPRQQPFGGAAYGTWKHAIVTDATAVAPRWYTRAVTDAGQLSEVVPWLVVNAHGRRRC